MVFAPELLAFLQIVLIDVSMAGDNAIAVGMAASGLPAEKRHKAVLTGVVAATVLRILFALFAVQMLRITGLLAAGGLLLLWVAWKMYRDIRHLQKTRHEGEHRIGGADPHKKLSSAILQIIIADVSMSLDNVLAVAGVARDHVWILIAGLAISVLLMGTAASLVARVTTRLPWVAYLGVIVVFYASLNMMWDGGQQLLSKM